MQEIFGNTTIHLIKLWLEAKSVKYNIFPLCLHRYTPQLNFSAIPDDEDTDWAYWFNSVPRGAKTGKENGFSVLFDIEAFDYGYYDEGSEGLKVITVCR